MPDKPLFSVLIPTYNQEKTICESISSVLVQDYENVELIVTDDASAGFDKDAVREHIESHRRRNLNNYQIRTHTRNMGTVKSLNAAIREASGVYVTVFAGDDLLYDEHTLSRYREAFAEHPAQNIITAQCYRYDEDMNELLLQQVPLERAHQINASPAPVQFRLLSEWNAFAMGATAFRREILEKYGYFDERYKLIEDWSLFLKLTRNGERFHFVDFVALKHRYGGLSKRKSKENSFALTSRDFCLDLLAVFENEIFPYMGELSLPEQSQRMTRYMGFVTANRDLLKSTIYEDLVRVKLRFLLRHPVTAVKLFLANRLKRPQR
jgi:glycosyltransferase involved in cell wall biosynthesis